MEIKTILKELEYNTGVFPRKYLEAAINKKEDIIPELLKILSYTVNNIKEVAEQENYFAHIYAMFLLAQFKEKRAYGLIVRIVSNPDEILDKLLGDVITENLGNILASVSCGDTSLIFQLIENKDVDEFVRSAALKSLLVLVACGGETREEIINYFRSLFSGKLEKKYSFVWDELVACCCNLHPEELYDSIEKAYDEGLVNPRFISLENVERSLHEKKEKVLSALQNNVSYRPIENTIAELEWWACFRRKEKEVEKNIETESYRVSEDYERKKHKVMDANLVRRTRKIGRNEPCPCGSGKKYKMCCGR